MLNRQKKQDGYTLLELLIVAIVICILIALLIIYRR
jgi:prepilin-type N-terminal cleavage/methylation domain-containing protein